MFQKRFVANFRGKARSYVTKLCLRLNNYLEFFFFSWSIKRHNYYLLSTSEFRLFGHDASTVLACFRISSYVGALENFYFQYCLVCVWNCIYFSLFFPESRGCTEQGGSSATPFRRAQVCLRPVNAAYAFNADKYKMLSLRGNAPKVRVHIKWKSHAAYWSGRGLRGCGRTVLQAIMPSYCCRWKKKKKVA